MAEIISKYSYEKAWAEIKADIQEGKAEWLHSGDMIPVTLADGSTVVLDVARDEKGEIYFVFHDCLPVTRRMKNRTATNKGGWAATELRKWANSEAFAMLPLDLQSVIAPTKIIQIVDGEPVECEDKLFCLSYTQVFGKGWTAVSAREPEDSQLDIFKSERCRVKECGDNGTHWWWLRSANGSNNFRYVCSDGSSYYGAYFSGGVALGFKL